MALKATEKSWLKMVGGTVVFWIGAILLAPYLQTGDPEIYIRTLLSRLLACSTSTVAVTGLVLWVDRVTPGDWFEEVQKGNMACALVLGAIFYGLYSLLTWAQS